MPILWSSSHHLTVARDQHPRLIGKISTKWRHSLKLSSITFSLSFSLIVLKTWRKNWTEWSNNKILAQAQKAKAADTKEQHHFSEQKERAKKRKSQDNNNSTKKLSCSQKTKNKRSKQDWDEEKETSQGQAWVCKLCKLVGVPSFVYKSHYTSQCNQKEQYAKQKSGRIRNRQKTREYKAMEKKFKQELKAL